MVGKVFLTIEVDRCRGQNLGLSIVQGNLTIFSKSVLNLVPLSITMGPTRLA